MTPSCVLVRLGYDKVASAWPRPRRSLHEGQSDCSFNYVKVLGRLSENVQIRLGGWRKSPSGDLRCGAEFWRIWAT